MTDGKVTFIQFPRSSGDIQLKIVIQCTCTIRANGYVKLQSNITVELHCTFCRLNRINHSREEVEHYTVNRRLVWKSVLPRRNALRFSSRLAERLPAPFLLFPITRCSFLPVYYLSLRLSNGALPTIISCLRCPSHRVWVHRSYPARAPDIHSNPLHGC